MSAFIIVHQLVGGLLAKGNPVKFFVRARIFAYTPAVICRA